MKKHNSRKPFTIEQKIAVRSAVSFLVFFVLCIAAYIGWRKLYTQKDNAGVQKTLRAGLKINEEVFAKVFDTGHLVKTYPKAKAEKNVRVNGNIGMGEDFDAQEWKLKLVIRSGDTMFITLEELKKLLKTEIIFDFKCIEGWSQVTHWGGVKFSDFIKAYDLSPQSAMQYVGLITPDAKYYVGIDMPSILQPQTLLCYEMNDKPLPLNQGYPLRLIIPCKYGIKSLKRIGSIYFSNEKPADYWAEKGYDYYSGL